MKKAKLGRCKSSTRAGQGRAEEACFWAESQGLENLCASERQQKYK